MQRFISRHKRRRIKQYGLLCTMIVVVLVLIYAFNTGRHTADQDGVPPRSNSASQTYEQTTTLLPNGEIRWFRKVGRNTHAIYYVHGGSFIHEGDDASYLAIQKRLARLSGYDIAAIDYRLMPQNPFPAGLNDVVDGYKYILRSGYAAKNIVVIGDSAGGNLALALTMKLRDEQISQPSALVLMSPFIDMRGHGESYETSKDNDMVFGEATRNRTNPNLSPILPEGVISDKNLGDKYLSLNNNSFEHLPPMLIQVGSNEVLLSDSRLIAERTRLSGGVVTLTEYSGMQHVFEHQDTEQSAVAWKEIKAFIKQYEIRL